MKESLKNLFLCAVLAGIVACGGSSDSNKVTDSEIRIGETSFLPVAGQSGSAAVGEKAWVAKMPLAEGVESGANFQLNFTLEEGGSLTFAGYAKNDLSDGVTLTFARVNNLLKVKVDSEGGEKDISDEFAGIKADGSLAFLVDIHNDETPVHMLVWSQSVSNPGPGNALVNHRELKKSGKGEFWGVKFIKANVTAAAAGTPKYEH